MNFTYEKTMANRAFKGKFCALAPDKGYAFVICLLSFSIYALTCGVTWTVGVFYVVFLEEFESSEGEIALLTSLTSAFSLTSGPLASILINRFGCRFVVILGGIVGCLGLVTSGFGQNVLHLYITFSFITGFGSGLTYTPPVVMLGLYFKKYRNFSIGVAASGLGAGMMVFPPVIQFLIQEFGWRGALMLLGGIYLHVALFGVLFFPLPTKYCEIENVTNNIKDYPEKIQNGEQCLSTEKFCFQKREYGIESMSLGDIRAHRPGIKSEKGSLGDIRAHRPGIKSEKGSLGDIRAHRQGLKSEKGSAEEINSKHSKHISVDNISLFMKKYKLTSNSNVSTVSTRSNKSYYKSTESVKVHVLTGSVIYLDMDENKGNETKGGLFNFVIFKNIGYLMTCFNNLFVMFGSFVVYVHVIAYAIDQGYTKTQGSHLLSIMGITGFFGRIGFGVLGNFKRIPAIPLYVISHSIVAMVTGLLPVCKTFPVIAFLFGCFGIMTASLGTLLPQMLIDILGIEYLASGYGYILVFEAVGTVIGPAAAGYLYESTQYYPASLFMGSLSFVISVLCMIWPIKQVHFSPKKNSDTKVVQTKLVPKPEC